MPVSLPWKGYGSAIFLELGRLSPLEGGRQRQNKGEACISFEWDWRIEKETAVLYGSSNSGPTIEKGIPDLRGAAISDISISGEVPELTIHFSNGQRLRSMVMVSGDPQWTVRTQDKVWIHCVAGVLFVGDGSASNGLTEDETRTYALADAAAVRWKIPVAEPKAGNCRDCQSFIRLDGNGDLLDYGACIEASSPFDGRVVNCESGCPAFSRDD
jgi:hypothetical protein